MTVTIPPLIDASPGDPITSEGWNGILGAIKAVVDYLNAQRGTLVVQVTNQADGNPIPGALVTVAPDGNPAGRPTRTALFAGSPVDAYQVDQLLPGAYVVAVEAAGFGPQTTSITMPDGGAAQTVAVQMAVAEAVFEIPNLFGQPVGQALGTITQQGFPIGRIIDSHGIDIAPGTISAEVQAASVLGQWPPAGTLAPKTTSFFLHISAKAEYLQRVNVPNLLGLTLEDAKTLLEANGLTLGVTTTVGT